MLIPAYAEEWAKENDVPGPPTDYDIIQAPARQPRCSDHQPGFVCLCQWEYPHPGNGSRGADFKSYSIQAGKGFKPPNPGSRLGKSAQTPVSSGLLGTWEPTEDGLYALRLMVTQNQSGNRNQHHTGHGGHHPHPLRWSATPTPGQQFPAVNRPPDYFSGGSRRFNWDSKSGMVPRSGSGQHRYPCALHL